MYKQFTRFSIAVLASAGISLSACAAPPPVTYSSAGIPGTEQAVPSLAPMLEKVTPAVVTFPPKAGSLRAAILCWTILSSAASSIFPMCRGSAAPRAWDPGWWLTPNGYVVTNHHVVEGAETITVTLRDGRQLKAKFIGSDPETDIAVIQVPATNLAVLTLADSDALRVGDYVVAIGNPFGLGQTVTSGIVSALGRSGLGIQGYENFIQTDASINPGNSGGALVNLRGELVGINTAIIAPSGGNVGIGFAIPSNMVRQLLEQLVRYGEVKRGRLGVTVQDLTPELSKAFGIELNQGAVIAQVAPDSAADRAGLKAGDVVTAINDKPIHSSNELRNTIGLLAVGEPLTLAVLRAGKPLTIKTAVGVFTPAAVTGKAINPRLAGAVFKEIGPGTPFYGQVEGILVDKVERGSPAERAGLRRNDIITGVNRQAVNEPQALQQLAAKGAPLLLNIQRGDTALLLVIE